MKTSEENLSRYKSGFEEILNDFFDQSEIAELQKRFDCDEEKPLNQISKNPVNSEQMNFKIINDYHIRFQIDLIITFAAGKLSKEKYLNLLLSLGQFAITIGELPSAIDINEKILLETKKEKSFSNISADAFLALGDIFSRQAYWQRSLYYIRKALRILKNQNDLKGCAKCENLWGTIFGECSQLTRARNHFEKSLFYLRGNPDGDLMGIVEMNLGIVNNIQGNFDAALSYFRKSSINFEKTKNSKRIAEVKHNIGMMYMKKEEYDSAITEFDQSISISLQTNYLTLLGISYLSKAYVYTKLNNFVFAEVFANKAREICHKANDRLSIAEIYKIKGIIQKGFRNFDLSENYLLTSLRINCELENKLNQAETAQELGILYKEYQREKESSIQFKNALKYYRKMNAYHEIKNIGAYRNN